MLKRQGSSLSSSRCQPAAVAGGTPTPGESAPCHARKAVNVGCMSGIFQLFSKYQSPNKRITFGRKQEQCRSRSSPMTKVIATKASSVATAAEYEGDLDTKRLTCDIKVPRSPTLPPEIRRSRGVTSSPEYPRTPSSLVARLMGLEDMAVAVTRPVAVAFEEDPITQKRRRLLQALEKCNEDLESLKRIIMAVQTGDVHRLQPPNAVAKRVRSNGMVEEMSIPVVAADELPRSPLSNTSVGAKRVPQPCKQLAVAKRPGEDDEPIAKLLNRPTTMESLQMRRRAAAAAASPPWSSRAMVQSVEEVCRDIVWGEKREIERIGVALQDNLWRDLVEEVIKELKTWHVRTHAHATHLPLEACKRRLRF